LDPAKIKTIAIIGPDAWPAVPGGGGSSHATAFEPVSTVTGIANFLGPDVHVLYSRGLPDMEDVFRQTHWQGGVKVEAFPDADFSGTPRTANTGSIVAIGAAMRGRPAAGAHYSTRYTTSFKADQAGP